MAGSQIIIQILGGYYLLSEKFANVQIRDYGFSVFDLVNSVKYKLGHIIGCVRTGGKH